MIRDGRQVGTAGSGSSGAGRTHVEQITGQIAWVTETISLVLVELRKLGDADTTALQIDAATAEPNQRVAETAGQAARTEADRRLGEQQRIKAVACPSVARCASNADTAFSHVWPATQRCTNRLH